MTLARGQTSDPARRTRRNVVQLLSLENGLVSKDEYDNSFAGEVGRTRVCTNSREVERTRELR